MTQRDALDILKTGVNVFLTGEPGAGKSYTVREYVAFLKSRGVSVALTASTGIAATHINGMTIHSWSGLGIRKHITKAECGDLATNAKLLKRITSTSVLIIDEISMLDAAMVDAIDTVCRFLRKDQRAFGGLQVVFVGDFFQLPPVSRADEPAPEFSFMAQAWRDAHPTICYLTEQHRQEDPTFLNVLSAIRRGMVDEDHVRVLTERRRPPTSVDITKLYSHNLNVDTMNGQRLAQLPGEEVVYAMTSFGAPPLIEQIKRGCLSPERLALRLGARVMFTRNAQDRSFVNGTLGTVVEIDKESKFPLVQTDSGRMILATPEAWTIEANGRPLATVNQVPLRLAWAMTVHKSQGMSLDAAYIDLAQAFAYGQGYVALSRVRTLEGLFLGGLNPRALEVDPTVLAKDEEFRAQSDIAEAKLGELSEVDRAAQADTFVQSCGGSKTKIAGVPEMTSDILSWRMPKAPKEPKWTQTVALLLEGKTLEEICRLRERKISTIIEHLELYSAEQPIPRPIMEGLYLSAKALTDVVHPVIEDLGADRLRPIFDHFEGKYSYDDLRLAQWLFVVKSQP